MKTRKWPRVVGAIVVLLVALFAAGALSASQGVGGDGGPLGVAIGVGISAIAIAAITALVLPVVLPRRAVISQQEGVTQFTISPLEPFTTSIAAVRWELGNGSRLPKFGSFARPLVTISPAGITIWKAGGDDVPLVTIPAASVQSVIPEEQKIQLSRTGMSGRFLCIVVELTIRSTSISLVLPACTPINQTTPAAWPVVDAWVSRMQETIDSLVEG